MPLLAEERGRKRPPTNALIHSASRLETALKAPQNTSGGSILITTNQSLAGWGEVFGDPLIATAILDRLLHHSTTINIKGESFRLKEKKRAGLLGRAEVRPAQDNELAPETAVG